MSLRNRLKRFKDGGTTADAVYKTLQQGILDGELAPGQRLRSDALAKDLDVSRTPIREALRKLEAEGLVEASPRSGLVVRTLSEEDLTEIFYVREALEGMAARLAAEHATQAEVEELRLLVEDMGAVAARGDNGAFRSLTGEFHGLVCRASHNKRLSQSLAILLNHVRQVPSSTLHMPGRPAEALEEHRSLVHAIEMRNPDLAEELARQHRRKTLALRREMIREQLRRDRARTVQEEDKDRA